jgi:hypothetical protein
MILSFTASNSTGVTPSTIHTLASELKIGWSCNIMSSTEYVLGGLVEITDAGGDKVGPNKANLESLGHKLEESLESEES